MASAGLGWANSVFQDPLWTLSTFWVRTLSKGVGWAFVQVDEANQWCMLSKLGREVNGKPV